MAEVGTALRAQGFGAHPAVAAVHPFLDRAGNGRLPEAGPPQPASNLVSDSNSLAPQQMQAYCPGVQWSSYLPVKGRSVAAWRVTSKASGSAPFSASKAFHSASVRVVCLVMMNS
jgi:hypothetical protein